MAEIKAPASSVSLVTFYNTMLAYQAKVVDFSNSKCQYQRDIEQCTLESLYYTNRQRLILTAVKTCREQCERNQLCLDKCVRLGEEHFEDLKSEVNAMV